MARAPGHAAPIQIELDDKKLMLEFTALRGTKTRAALEVAMAQAMQYVAFKSVSDFMIPRPGPHDGTIGMRTTELMRSISAQFGFRRSDLGGTKHSVREIKQTPTGVEGLLGSSLPYAAIHEYGGEYVHNNLFGRGITATIRMPARPYLHPAVEASRGAVHSIFELMLKNLVK